MSQIDKQGYVTIGHFAYKLRGMTSEQKQVLAAKLIKRWELTQAQEDALRLLENSEDDLLMIHSMLKFLGIQNIWWKPSPCSRGDFHLKVEICG